MPISMYQASVPVFQRNLANLAGILRKAEAFAKERNIEPSILLNGRLAPDMFPLTRQVQVATDHAKGATARLADVEVPAWADDEASFDELHARLEKTQKFMAGFSAGQIDGSDEREIRFKAGPYELEFTGVQYLLAFAMPNFYFHLTTAFAILRHNGVPIGKLDYLGGLPK